MEDRKHETHEHDHRRDPREPRKVPADSPIGTTHDPNSTTTGTEVEPDDVFPPRTKK
jgi:hypothetical protein